MDAFEVREGVLSWMKNVPPLTGCANPSSGERGVITNLLNNCLNPGHDTKEANIRRRYVLAWLFRDLLNHPMYTEISAKELTDDMWWALCRYVDPHKDIDNGWYGKEGLCEEMYTCWRAMVSWENDMNHQLGFDV